LDASLDRLLGCSRLTAATQDLRKPLDIAVEIIGEAIHRATQSALQPIAIRFTHLADPAILQHRKQHHRSE
jgi:hypothetical protein